MWRWIFHSNELPQLTVVGNGPTGKLIHAEPTNFGIFVLQNRLFLPMERAELYLPGAALWRSLFCVTECQELTNGR
jgi:hypothetical protein